MRGKAYLRIFAPLLLRITPAYAGKRSGSAEGSGMRQDHPRLCGEKNDLISGMVLVIGSPPPMRGKGFA